MRVPERDPGLVEQREPRGPADHQVDALADIQERTQHGGGVWGAGSAGHPYDPRRTGRLSWLDWVHDTEPIRLGGVGTGRDVRAFPKADE
ncbi:hypothetical protein GCM10010251_63980 [Streptomyces aurantiogriseus]|uniref:Uncharacterized protein n=1 Tax=Streptomyces aurantiogriseus TaxID=66870 RepID=A0A918KWZ9_9ACTN|nr:hypothetical protein GCM10010251_63980 [Streptomyces aurantiogriseus]